MRYELTTLAGSLLRLGDMDAAAEEWMAQAAAGTVLGRWRTDIGSLGQVLLLRGFEDERALAEERRRALLDRDPFGVRDMATSISQESYEGFPFLPPATPRRAGGVYEFRTYVLRAGSQLGWSIGKGVGSPGMWRPAISRSPHCHAG